MEFNWLYAIGVFVVGCVLGLMGSAQTQAQAERQRERYKDWVASGRGWGFGESEIVPITRAEVVMGALCLAVVVGFVAPALAG